jgi:uncharacterized protein (DUF433 family)
MATRTRSFRLSEETLQRLEQRASEVGATASALAARFIEEGLRMDAHPLVVFRERPAGRRAMLAGSRLNISDVVVTAKDAGSVELTAESLNLPLWKVRAALSYYADFEDEVDAEIERDREFAEREEARWRREQSALA